MKYTVNYKDKTIENLDNFLSLDLDVHFNVCVILHIFLWEDRIFLRATNSIVCMLTDLNFGMGL